MALPSLSCSICSSDYMTHADPSPDPTSLNLPLSTKCGMRLYVYAIGMNYCVWGPFRQKLSYCSSFPRSIPDVIGRYSVHKPTLTWLHESCKLVWMLGSLSLITTIISASTAAYSSASGSGYCIMYVVKSGFSFCYRPIWTMASERLILHPSPRS